MRRTLVAIGLLITAACTASSDSRPAVEDPAAPYAPALVRLPAPEPARPIEPEPRTGVVAAVVDDRGQLAAIDPVSGQLDPIWRGWHARLAPDGTLAAVTRWDAERDATLVSWLSLPGVEAEPAGVAIAGPPMVATATQHDGGLVALVTDSEPVVDGHIAGARSTSTISFVSPDDGEVYRIDLEGNFVPEAFGRRIGRNGLPAQLFLLEYFPAVAPRFYRVRVLSTETDEISLPVNLRDKTRSVDERMAGFSRSQVVADEHGLLFTLYRGTIEGTPDGTPYAFVHTLDLADGVWCLEVDPELELDALPGTLAVGGDRLYVASANGKIGSFRIPSITDPDLSPTMDWVTQVMFAGDEAPVAIADGDGVLVGFPQGGDRLVRVGADSTIGMPRALPGEDPLAVDRTTDGRLHAIGDGWSTFGAVVVPDWFGQITQLITN